MIGVLSINWLAILILVGHQITKVNSICFLLNKQKCHEITFYQKIIKKKLSHNTYVENKKKNDDNHDFRNCWLVLCCLIANEQRGKI